MPESKRLRQDGRTFIEQARRRQIVEAAIEVLAEAGYAQTSLERIALRAGISRGLISYHFAGRDDLMAEVIAKAYKEGTAYMRPRLEAATTPAEALHEYVRSNLEFMRDHRMHLLALLAIRRGGNPAGLRESMSGLGAALGPIERILRWGQEQGAFQTFDPHVMAIGLRNVIDGLPHYMGAEPDLDLDACLREVTALFSRAVEKPVSEVTK
ncbi:MAG TPA: helix-turn-helix domain-containing protein [Stellaceae bacterium]|nr:helix-turn-helix domain-containing protein [Stellaceae bacterium]